MDTANALVFFVIDVVIIIIILILSFIVDLDFYPRPADSINHFNLVEFVLIKQIKTIATKLRQTKINPTKLRQLKIN